MAQSNQQPPAKLRPDYGRSPNRKLLWMFILLSVPISAVAFLWASKVTLVDEEVHIDYVTGSTTTYEKKCFGLSKSTQFTPSPLELRMKASGIPWTPDWHLRNHIQKGVMWKSWACNTARMASHLGPFSEIYAKIANNDDIREFVHVMQTGTEADKAAKLEEVSARSLRAIEEGKWLP